MIRREKLTRSERARRSSKRLRRKPKSDLKRRLEEATRALQKSLRDPIISDVVCEHCGLAQPYVTDMDGDFPESEDRVVLCRREEFLGIPCSGEYCISIDHYGYDSSIDTKLITVAGFSGS